MNQSTNLFFLPLILTLVAALAKGGEWFIKGRAEARLFSNPSDLIANFNDWDRISQPQSRNRLVLFGESELSVRYQDWEAGLISHRTRLYGNIPGSYLNIIGNFYQQRNQANEGNYAHLPTIRGYIADGWYGALHIRPTERQRFTLRFNILHPTDLHHLNANGSGTIINNRSEMQSTIIYYSRRDYRKFFKTKDSSDASGLSIDLVWSYCAQQWAIDIGIDDLFGRLVWRDAHRTTIELNTQTTWYDNYGYLHRHPFIQGKVESNQLFIQHLQPLPWIRVAASNHDLNVSLLYRHSPEVALTSLQTTLKTKWGEFGVGCELPGHYTTLLAGWKHLKISAGASNWGNPLQSNFTASLLLQTSF